MFTRNTNPNNNNQRKNNSNSSKEEKGIVRRPWDKYLLGAILFLVVFGLVALFSASLVTAHSSQGNAYYYIEKQLLALLLGLGSLFLFSKIDYHYFKKLSLIFLIASFVLLILVFVPGLRAEHGTSYSWLIVFGMSFQVAELVKLLLIFYIGCLGGNQKRRFKEIFSWSLAFFGGYFLGRAFAFESAGFRNFYSGLYYCYFYLFCSRGQYETIDNFIFNLSYGGSLSFLSG